MELKKFRIAIRYHNLIFRYTVTLKEVTERDEIYVLHTKSKIITFTNNRPFLTKRGLKHWVPSWKVSEQLMISSFTEDIIREIEKNIDMVRK